MSYAIPTNELTLTDIKNFKIRAKAAGIARAVEKLGVKENELVVREALPGTDFVLAYTAGSEVYISPTLVAGWLNQMGDLNAAAVLPVGRVAVFYKIADWQANPDVTAVRFRQGPGGASTKGVFHIQLSVNTKLESEVYLSEAIVYDPQDTLWIQYYAIAGGATEDIGFGCFIIEKIGATVS